MYCEVATVREGVECVGIVPERNRRLDFPAPRRVPKPVAVERRTVVEHILGRAADWQAIAAKLRLNHAGNSIEVVDVSLEIRVVRFEVTIHHSDVDISFQKLSNAW